MKRCLKCNNEHSGVFGSGKYCSRSCANSRTFSENSLQKKSLANRGKTPWNKGLQSKVVASKCLYCSEDINHWISTPKKYHASCWRKVSGGLRRGSGRGKSGWYKGFWCDSSYELAWVIYQLDHNRPFERNRVKYQYTWKSQIRTYTPDFIQNGEIIEIKGFMTEQTRAKLVSVPNLKVLFASDMRVEFDYVKHTYGKNYIQLYEGNPYKDKSSKCILCGAPAAKQYCSRRCSAIGNKQ